MNKGGIAKRLVRLARLLVGWVPGYLAATNVLANMFFGAVQRILRCGHLRYGFHHEPAGAGRRL